MVVGIPRSKMPLVETDRENINDQSKSEFDDFMDMADFI